MTWFRVDDQILDNAKVEALHEALADDENTLHAAMHVWLVAGVYSARNLTDGRVRESKLRQLCQASSKVFTKAVDHLAACGLLERSDGCVEMPNWSEWNPTREQVEERRRKDAGRKQSARTPRGAQTESARSPDGPCAESDRNPRLPDPDPDPDPDPRERGAAPAAPLARGPEKSGEEGAAARLLEPSEAERSAVADAVRHLPRVSASAGVEATLEVLLAVASGGGPPIAAQVRELGAVEAALVSRGDVSRRVALDLVRTFCQRAKPVALATPPPPRGRGWREFKDAR